MITDQLDNAGMYGGLGERIAMGLALLNEEYVRTAAEGKYEVQGEDLYFMVQEYQTKPFEEGRVEIHRRYMDIQYIVSGRECIVYHPFEGLTEEQPYDGQKDVAFYRRPAAISRIMLEAGMFAIFWPQEPHLPSRAVSNPEKVKKIVVKVRME
jgi:YhcH/YjgK/YiaL family protein